jgi:pimeloyl-ACP methyl ester carboxylesterase
MSSNLVVVICHGFFHNAAIYRPLVDVLKSHGIDAYCPQLPMSDLSKLNVGDIISPNFDLDPPSGGYPQGEEDTQAVLAVLKLLIEDQHRRVLLAAHSGGGFAATQSAIPELQEKHRQSRGLTGGIVGIFYYGAFIVPLGESLHTTFQPKDGRIVTPPWLQFHVSLQ